KSTAGLEGPNVVIAQSIGPVSSATQCRAVRTRLGAIKLPLHSAPDVLSTIPTTAASEISEVPPLIALCSVEIRAMGSPAHGARRAHSQCVRCAVERAMSVTDCASSTSLAAFQLRRAGISHDRVPEQWVRPYRRRWSAGTPRRVLA